ncbi:MAG TPA: phosphate ABC transporter substrate-binding protein PstS [Bryobacteraceae bacterium]|nr:phosphate ABC transporter substrate-binding protein PstS [Bryobacteraceae bacterium]
MTKTRLAMTLPAVLGMVLASSASVRAETINAAGATFPAVIYQKWFQEYRKLHSDVQVNYQSIGSGAGIQQLTQGTVDFGASDMPMTNEQLAKVTKYKVLHFPTVMGGLVPTYNLPGMTDILNFTPETLAGIYLGTITKWSDARLKKDNPKAKLPDADITVVHRSDGSGTTFVWTDYLAKVSPDWKAKVGAGTSVAWPTGLGGKGNEGVAGTVKETPNSIGYVELIYAAQNKMAYGAVKNSAGEFVRADFDTVSEAAAGAAKNMPDDFRVSITNAPGKKAYPISSFTWLLIPNKFDNATKKNAIQGFLKWMLADGQKFAAGLDYAPLPKPVVDKEEKQIGMIQ